MVARRRAFLLLGEGDFTFTRALRQHLPEVTLVTTSFDSRSEVTEKYKDVESQLLRWDKEENIHVFHGIDATLGLREQLRERSCEVAEFVFDTVCFNFPHLGVEDARLHGLMVAHVMQRAMHLFSYNKETLGVQASDCRFVLALADAQALRWHTREMGLRNQLHQVDTYPFRATDWPGYEIRRHINGKSFKTRVDSCSFLIHAPQEGGGEDTSAFVSLLRRLREKAPVAAAAKKESEKMSLQSQEEPLQKNKKKKRKVATLTDGHWTSRAPTAEECSSGGIDLSSLVYDCSICGPGGKIFKSEASIVGHVYNVHFMSSSSSTPTTYAKQSESKSEEGKSTTTTAAAAPHSAQECNICGKQVKGADALRMHMRAAHGDYEVLKPDWAAKLPSPPVAAAGTSTAPGPAVKETPSPPNPLFADMTAAEISDCPVECKACGTFFASEEVLTEHQQRGFQPQEPRNEVQTCPHCSRQFKDQRALFQHMNLCKAL